SGTTNFTPGDISNSTFSINGAPTTTGVGIGTLNVAGNLNSSVTIDAPAGITTLTASRDINGTITTENPLLATSGKLGTLTAADFSGNVYANSIGTFKTVGNLGLFPFSTSFTGNLNGTITTLATSGVGLGTLSVLGTFNGTIIVPASLASITASQGIN